MWPTTEAVLCVYQYVYVCVVAGTFGNTPREGPPLGIGNFSGYWICRGRKRPLMCGGGRPRSIWNLPLPLFYSRLLSKREQYSFWYVNMISINNKFINWTLYWCCPVPCPSRGWIFDMKFKFLNIDLIFIYLFCWGRGDKAHGDGGYGCVYLVFWVHCFGRADFETWILDVCFWFGEYMKAW